MIDNRRATISQWLKNFNGHYPVCLHSSDQAYRSILDWGFRNMITPAGRNRFGQIDGVNEGRIFDNRLALSQAGVNGSTQNGISGTQTIGCDSIVLNGAYRDDDRGDVINYSGENPRGGSDADNQLLVGGNLAVKVSHDNELPVRVTRASGSDTGAVRVRER